MQRLTPRSVILVWAGLLLVAALPASAQSPRRRSGVRRYPSVTSEPLVSPYLNLALPTGDPGFNYMTLVQPQLQQQRYNQQQTAQTQLFNRELQQQEHAFMTPYGPIGGIRPTGGIAATFQNYSHYYPSKGQGASGGRPRQYRVSGLGGAAGGGMGMGGMGMGMF